MLDCYQCYYTVLTRVAILPRGIGASKRCLWRTVCAFAPLSSPLGARPARLATHTGERCVEAGASEGPSASKEGDHHRRAAGMQSPRISPRLLTSPHTSHHLPTSPHISPHRTLASKAVPPLLTHIHCSFHPPTAHPPHSTCPSCPPCIPPVVPSLYTPCSALPAYSL